MFLAYEVFNCVVNLFCRCEHEKRKSAVACMSEVIGENNSEHFFVATQDAELRKKFKEVSYCKRKYDLPVFHATYIFEELNFLFL